MRNLTSTHPVETGSPPVGKCVYYTKKTERAVSDRAVTQGLPVEVAERARRAALRQRHRARVEDREPARQLLQFRNVRVAMCEHRAQAERRQAAFVPVVPVRAEERLTAFASSGPENASPTRRCSPCGS